MAIITKYEKIDSQHIRKWTCDDVQLVKVDLQQEKADYQGILNRSVSEKTKIKNSINPQITVDEYDAVMQEKEDELDFLIDLFNKSTTNETIPFLNP